MLTVKELIEQLQQHNQDDFVFIPGYEGGLANVSKIETTQVALFVNDEWWYGDHEKIRNSSQKEEFIENDKEIVNGIIFTNQI